MLMKYVDRKNVNILSKFGTPAYKEHFYSTVLYIHFFIILFS